MNYIAHLHIAKQTNTSLLGSFLGDFVKGSQLDTLPDALRIGVTLHRKVDVFTDAHEEVARLKSHFPDGLRKMSGVVLDIYFDHLLMQHWSAYASEPVEELFDLFYQDLDKHKVSPSTRYERVKQSLLAHQWLRHYIERSQCHGAFVSIEQRLKNKIVFADDAMAHLNAQHDDIEQAFQRFYPHLLDYATEFVADLTP